MQIFSPAKAPRFISLLMNFLHNYDLLELASSMRWLAWCRFKNKFPAKFKNTEMEGKVTSIFIGLFYPHH